MSNPEFQSLGNIWDGKNKREEVVGVSNVSDSQITAVDIIIPPSVKDEQMGCRGRANLATALANPEKRGMLRSEYCGVCAVRQQCALGVSMHFPDN